ncbi:hypothetical protein ACVIIV_005423 [Bradyrhizobium sp. USDA 4354]
MTEITRRATLAGAAASALLPFVKTSPASAAAPPATAQNASFYRYNVGTHQVTVVCDGVATVNLTDNYAAGASKDDINKVFAEHHLPTDKVTHTFNPVVINTGPKLVVIDTGLGPDQFTQTKGKVGQFHNNLAAASIDRAGGRHRHHLPLPWRPHQRPAGSREQARLPQCRDHGAGGGMEVLDGRRRDEQGDGQSDP